MSARGLLDLRYREAFERARPFLQARFASSPIDLVTIPQDRPIRTTLKDCANILKSLSPMSLDTGDMLRTAISNALTDGMGPIIVISDQPIAATSDRVVQITPEQPVQDVGIARLAARESPSPQVMVRVRNQSGLTSTSLVVSSAGQSIRQQIDLPTRGDTRDYFIDLPKLGPTVAAELIAQDDLAANNFAWLVREGGSARIEPRASLPAELRRVIDVYQHARPAMDGAARAQVVRAASQLPNNVPGVVLAPSDLLMQPASWEITHHSITDHVDWERLPGSIRLAKEPPGGWTPLVSMAGRVLVAVRPEPPNQVWVGFDVPNWPATADYVIFWTNIFDWVGSGSESFVSHQISEWTPEWTPTERFSGQGTQWPGLYRRSDGALRAFNAPDVTFLPPPQRNWEARLSDVHLQRSGWDVSSLTLLTALFCISLSTIVWKVAYKPAKLPDGPVQVGWQGPS